MESDLDHIRAAGSGQRALGACCRLRPLRRDAYLLQAGYDDREAASAINLAGPLIEQALFLDPNSADAYASRGILMQKQYPAVTNNYLNTMIELGRYSEARSVLAARSLADRAMLKMSAQLALQASEWQEAVAPADRMTEDVIGAHLLPRPLSAN